MEKQNPTTYKVIPSHKIDFLRRLCSTKSSVVGNIYGRSGVKIFFAKTKRQSWPHIRSHVNAILIIIIGMELENAQCCLFIRIPLSLFIILFYELVFPARSHVSRSVHSTFPFLIMHRSSDEKSKLTFSFPIHTCYCCYAL